MSRLRLILLCLYAYLFLPSAHAALSIEVTITGIEGELQDNVLHYLSIEQQKNHPRMTPGRLGRLHNKATSEISEALQPFGYYSPTIQSELKHSNDNWQVIYKVDPGPPTIVSDVNIEIIGDADAKTFFEPLIKAFPIKRLDRLVHEKYEQGKTNLLKYGLENGYLKARLGIHQVHVNTETQNATITLQMQPGMRHRFGNFVFKQEGLAPDFLESFAPYKYGDYYNTDKLFELQTALVDSGYFSQVEVRGLKEQSEDGYVPVEVTAVPLKKHRYSMGLGYGTDTGPRLKLGWKNRRINQKGHHLETDLKISQVVDSATGRYYIPIRNPRTDFVTLTMSWEKKEPDTSKSETLLWGINQSVIQNSGWRRNLYLNYQFESFQIENTDEFSRLFIPGISWSITEADNRINPRRGYRILLDFRSGVGFDFATGIGTETFFLQSRINGKLVHPMGDSGKLILRGDFGTMRAEGFEHIPASQRFFAGGDNSVRGYRYQSLAPEDGGKHLIVGSTEYEHRIKGDWSAALFYDIGNAITNYRDPLKEGAGIGLRWQSPVGAIRLDYAWALSEPGTPREFHLILGPEL
ncbi:MAG: autotransporter assembly complex family protein [Gammaproteobacteria bacterium]